MDKQIQICGILDWEHWMSLFYFADLYLLDKTKRRGTTFHFDEGKIKRYVEEKVYFRSHPFIIIEFIHYKLRYSVVTVQCIKYIIYVYVFSVLLYMYIVIILLWLCEKERKKRKMNIFLKTICIFFNKRFKMKSYLCTCFPFVVFM